MINKNWDKIILSAITMLLLSCHATPVTQIKQAVTSSPDSIAVDLAKPAINNSEKTTVDTLVIPGNEKPLVDILQTGILQAGEVKKNAAQQQWIGLFKIGRMFFTRHTQLEITPVSDTLSGGEIKTALMVNTSLFNRCVILISGLSDLKETNVKTVTRTKDTILPGERLAINFNNINYTLSATGQVQRKTDGATLISNYKMFLSSTDQNNEVKQLLVAQPELNNNMASIIWMGDLDIDGKLDLILNASPNEGISTPALYLSSKSGKGTLVKFCGQHIAK